jgi:predicted Zn-dependent protease
MVLLSVALLCAPTARAEEPDKVLAAMQAELDRSMADLALPGYPAPYFLAFRVTDAAVIDVAAKVGALFPGREADVPVRQSYVEVRTGDHDVDNFSSTDVSFETYLPDFSPSGFGPIEDDPMALRHSLWLLVDTRYKEALSTFNRLRGERVYRHEERMPRGFARVPVLRFVQPVPTRPKIDRAAWGERLKEASRVFLDAPDVFDSEARFRASYQLDRLVTSEGTLTRVGAAYYEIHVSGFVRSADGRLIDHGVHFYARDEAGLPDQPTLLAATRELAAILLALRSAPTLQPYTGPAILSPLATGVFFHETIGHRLEGERHNKEFEGKTFEEKLGERILPSFLSLIDDPTLTAWEGVPLFGAYEVDHEGVRTGRTVLIEDGVLKGYLMSRQTTDDMHASNGHGRASPGAKPMSRMGNLIVTSSQTVPYAELKRLLLAAVKAEGKPFGLIIDEIKGGDTNTSTWGYQAFRDVPSIVRKVDPDTGAETLVTGVEMVGTPLISLNRIVAMSDQTRVFNGHCGAESGYVPVSAIAPAALFQEIELQRSPEKKERDLLIPAPYAPKKERH